jgi:hypothetical protein
MKPLIPITALLAVLAVAGCQGNQDKRTNLTQLQAQYKSANKQYNDDCIAPNYGAAGANDYFKGAKPKVATPQEEAANKQKCDQELKQVTALEQQMTAASK